MSRSYRKNPIVGIADDSEKEDKQQANRKFRRATRIALHCEQEPPFNINQVSSPWAFAKDGKIRISRDWYDSEREYRRAVAK